MSKQTTERKRRYDTYVPWELPWVSDWHALAVKIGIVGVVVWTLFPIYWVFTLSLRTRGEIFDSSSNWLIDIFNLNFVHFGDVIFNRGFLDYVLNSLIIATGNTILVLVLAVPAAYAFRVGLRGSKDVFFWILTNRMAPPPAFLLPLFFIASALNLVGTYWILILTYCLFNLPFAIWLLYGIMQGIPDAIDEAVYIDGGNDVDVLTKVILPLSKPGIAVTGLLVWLFAWNHYVFTILLADKSTLVITNGIAQFFTTTGTSWGAVASATVISMIPGLVLAAFIQKHIVTGFTFGAVKG